MINKALPISIILLWEVRKSRYQMHVWIGFILIMILPFLTLVVKNSVLFQEPFAPFIFLDGQIGDKYNSQGYWNSLDVARNILFTYPLALVYGNYVFQLKPEYSSTIRKYASRPILQKATQKTLSYIAYMQPISTRQLVEIRGTGVYGQLKELRQLDFIEHQSAGRLKIYSTTEKFQKYFGIQGDVNVLKQKLFKRIRK